MSKTVKILLTIFIFFVGTLLSSIVPVIITGPILYFGWKAIWKKQKTETKPENNDTDITILQK